MRKRIAVLLVIIMTIGVALYAAPHGRRGMHGGEGFGIFGHLRHLKGELDLTDAQTAQIRAIFLTAREKNAPYREQLHGGMRGIAETLIANPNDVARAQQLLDQQAAAEKALKANLLQATSDALQVLTPEQRQKLSTIVEEHASRFGKRRG